MKANSLKATMLVITSMAMIIFMFSCTSCSRKGSESLAPAIGSITVSNITKTGATISVPILADGGQPISAQGVSLNDVKRYTSDAFGLKSFSVIISDLSPNTEYRVRGYATNSVGAGYSDEVKFTTLGPPPQVKDIDGNGYDTLRIGTQTWMLQNLKVTHYRDGSPIPIVTDGNSWSALTTGAACYCNGDPSNTKDYGLMYNWYAVNDPRGLAPAGWHIPSYTEFYTLIQYFGGTVAGGHLRETGTTHWLISEGNGSSGFLALGNGDRGIDQGKYYDFGHSSSFWTSEQFVGSADAVYIESITIYWSEIFDKASGFGVRCVKD